MIRDGLNKEVVQAAIETFEEDPDPVFEKARSIRRAMMEALEGGKSNSSQISLRFLFSLKKEFYIFLALVGGRSARLIIRNALRLYGNPEAHIYLNGVAKRGLPNFMQHLKVVVRGIGRVGHRRDIAVLNEIAACELAFKKLDKSVRHQASVGRIMQWVDKSKYSISAKG